MSIYDDNVKALLASIPYLKSVLDVHASAELEVFETLTGSVSGKYRGLSVHSRHNPEREAAQIIEEIAAQLTKRESGTEISSALFYGFGFGYHVEAFVMRFPHVPVLVIEPDPGLFRKVLESRDLRIILNNPDISFYVESDPEKLLPRIEKLPLSNIQIVRLRSVYEFNRQFYNRIDGIVSSYLSKKEININTLKRFGRLWIRNLAHNLKAIAEKPGIRKLSDTLEGIPALVLASGPSLDELLPFLPELRKRMVIISVDTSLRACLSAGVEPDFLLVVDPQYWNTRHLDWLSVRKTIVVSESSTHPRVFRMLDAPCFFASSIFPLGRFFESVAGKKGKIGTGGSVSTCAWDFARIIGACLVFMAGLDLGFPGKKTHFHGAYFEQGFHAQTYRLKPIEHLSFRYLQEAAPFPVLSNSGGFTLTDKRMIIYKWWFETQMNLHQSVTTCTFSKHGVAIPGIGLTDIKTALDLPIKREFIDEKMDFIRTLASGRQNIRKKTQRLARATEKLITGLSGLSKIAGIGIKATEKAKSSISGGKIPQKIIEELDAVDNSILNSSSRVIAGFLIQPIIQGILHTTQVNATPEEVLSNTGKLYVELDESCRYHAEILSKSLERIR